MVRRRMNGMAQRGPLNNGLHLTGRGASQVKPQSLGVLRRGGLMLSRREVEDLLSKLCIELGFCLDPADQDQLAAEPPADVRTFTDAVFVAEGLDPALADRHLY